MLRHIAWVTTVVLACAAGCAPSNEGVRCRSEAFPSLVLVGAKNYFLTKIIKNNFALAMLIRSALSFSPSFPTGHPIVPANAPTGRACQQAHRAPCGVV
jgi:hypothetical protein